MNTRVLFAAVATLWLLPVFNPAWGQDDYQKQAVPFVYGIDVDPGENAYLIRQIQGKSQALALAQLPDERLHGYDVKSQELPGGNHVWMAGASQQSTCNGVRQSLQDLAAELDRAIRLTDELELDKAAASLQSLFTALPCLGEYVDPDLLYGAHFRMGILAKMEGKDVNVTSRHFRDALVNGGKRPWNDSYPKEYEEIYDDTYVDFDNWSKDGSPFWVPVHVEIDGAKDVRVNGKSGVAQVLPGTHLIQWKDADGNFHGRTFVVRPNAGTRSFGVELQTYREEGEVLMAVIEEKRFKKTLLAPNIDDAIDRGILRAYLGSLTVKDKAVLMGVTQTEVIGILWTRNGGEGEFLPFDVSAIKKMLPKSEDTTAIRSSRKVTVYGGLSIEGGVRVTGASYGEARIGGHLNPGAGVWFDLTLSLALSGWVQPDNSTVVAVLPEVGFGGRYVFQTPAVSRTHLRPFLGGRAILTQVGKSAFGGGGVGVFGVEIHPSGDKSPLWLRLGGYAGAIGTKGTPYPAVGVALGFALHKEHLR